MIQVEEMRDSEIEGLLGRVNYGHLACVRDGQPYVVPIHYAYDKPNFYIYTTEGMKAGILRDNPKICLQVEEVIDNSSWQSVIVMGEAEQITGLKEREEIIHLIRKVDPTLTPAISIPWVDNWVRENVEVIFRITPVTVTGRSGSTIKARGAAATPKQA
jgi:nitroimidazol reductase NimA-like FMN-containing flavoprotein (pyridoxamine 5'-phosphate oxidase superfamily)